MSNCIIVILGIIITLIFVIQSLCFGNDIFHQFVFGGKLFEQKESDVFENGQSENNEDLQSSQLNDEIKCALEQVSKRYALL